jgi:hypothetical protein
MKDTVGVEHGDPPVAGLEGSVVLEHTDGFIHRLATRTEQFSDRSLRETDLSEPILLGEQKISDLLANGPVHEPQQASLRCFELPQTGHQPSHGVNWSLQEKRNESVPIEAHDSRMGYGSCRGKVRLLLEHGDVPDDRTGTKTGDEALGTAARPVQLDFAGVDDVCGCGILSLLEEVGSFVFVDHDPCLSERTGVFACHRQIVRSPERTGEPSSVLFLYPIHAVFNA